MMTMNRLAVKLRQWLEPERKPLRGYYETTKAWAEQQACNGNGLRPYVEIHAPQPFHRTPPKTVEPVMNARFANMQLPRQQTEPTFVAQIPHGRVCGNLGDVITPDGKLLWDVTTWTPDVPRGPQVHWLLKQTELPPATHLTGRVANLSGDWPENYHHWLVEILPRIELLRLAGIDLRSIDTFLFNPLTLPYQPPALASLGIPPEKIVFATPATHYRCDLLIAPSFARGAGCGIGWIYQFLRHQFLEPLGAVGEANLRLYVSRSAAAIRNVQNERDIMELLRRYGFQPVCLESLDFFEQVRLLARAEAVVGPHGAGLTNLAFAPPRTKVIEFTMPDRVHYWGLSQECGLDYYYINGFPELPSDFTDGQWDFNADMQINLDTLQQTLKFAGIAPRE